MKTQKAACLWIVILIGIQGMAADEGIFRAGGRQQMKKAERYVEG